MVRTLVDLEIGEEGVIAGADAAPDLVTRLMELGFIPGAVVRSVRAVTGGDPRVYRVDGAEIALRADTARCLLVRAPR
jgi:ferrous iron transport protein A